jgi:hypothetical protein
MRFTLLRNSHFAYVGLAGVLMAAGFAAIDAKPAAEPTAELRLNRTWMPNAYPSSFAIGFPGGLNCCFDPMRGKVIYAWRGDYVDLQPTVNGKIPRDAAIRGTIFYEAAPTAGWRSGPAMKESEIHYKGHRVKGGIPEFSYEVDGVPVHESIAPAPDGKGLIRRFRVATPDRGMLYRVEDPGSVAVESGPAKPVEGGLQLPGNASIVFTVRMQQP